MLFQSCKYKLQPKDAVINVSALGIMNGTGGGNFSPKATYSGFQAIVTMLRLYNKTVSQ